MINLTRFLGLFFIISSLCNCTTETVNLENQSAFKFHLQSDLDYVVKAEILADGSFIIIGNQHEAPTVLMLNPDFSVKFIKEFSNYAPGVFSDVTETNNGEIVLVGSSSASSFASASIDPEALIVWMSKAGTVLNQATKDVGQYDSYSAVTSTTDGKIIAVGSSNQNIIFDTYKNHQFTDQVYQYTGGIDALFCADFFETSFGYFAFWNFIVYPEKGLFRMLAQNLNDSFVTTGDLDFGLEQYRVPPNFFSNRDWMSPRCEVITTKTPNNYIAVTYIRNYPYFINLTVNQSGITENWIKRVGTNPVIVENCIPIGDDFIILGKTLPLDPVDKSIYSTVAYAARVDANGEVIWENMQGSNLALQTAIDASINQDKITILGYQIDPTKTVNFLSYQLDFDGNLILNE